MKLLVSAAEGAEILDASERKFHDLRHDPKFPAPVSLGPRCNRWRLSSLQAYVESLEAAPPAGEPIQLRGARALRARELQGG